MTMPNTAEKIPQPQAILRALVPFKETLGVTRIRSEADYAQICVTVEVLLDEIGDD